MATTTLSPTISSAYSRAAAAPPPPLWDRALLLACLMQAMFLDNAEESVLRRAGIPAHFSPDEIFHKARVGHHAHISGTSEDNAQEIITEIGVTFERTDMILNGDYYNGSPPPHAAAIARIGRNFYHQYDTPFTDERVYHLRTAKPELTLHVSSTVLMRFSEHHKILTGQDTLTKDAKLSPLQMAQSFFANILDAYSPYRDEQDYTPGDITVQHTALTRILHSLRTFLDCSDLNSTLTSVFQKSELRTLANYIQPYEVSDHVTSAAVTSATMYHFPKKPIVRTVVPT